MKQKKEKNSFFKQIAFFFHTDIGKAFLVAILWQLIMTLIGMLFDSSLKNIFQNPSNLPPTPPTLFTNTSGWDSGWYFQITQGAYLDTSSPASVFYPLFPLLVYLVHTASFGLIDYLPAGLLINTSAVFLCILSLLKISKIVLPEKITWWLPILFLTSPAALFLHFFYTEAIFCAVAFWAYLFALRRNWGVMAILLAILTAVRLPSVLFIGLCGLEFLHAYHWNIKRIFNRNLLWFLVAPTGFLIYGIFLYIVRGDFLAMFHGYNLTTDWSYHKFNLNIFDTYHKAAHVLYHTLTSSSQLTSDTTINVLFPALGLAIVTLTSILLLFSRKSRFITLGVFGIVSVIFFSLNSDLVSIHRYILPCLSIYVALANLSSKSKVFNNYFLYTIIYGGIMLQTYLFIIFVNGYFAG